MSARGKDKQKPSQVTATGRSGNHTMSPTRGIALSNVLLVIGVVLFLSAAGGLAYVGLQYYQGERQYDSLAKYAMSGEIADTTAEVTVEAEDDYTIQVDWQALLEINPDIVAWIRIPNTNVDYPVVQTTDNDYYLEQTFDGTGNRYGCIFLDYQSSSDFSDLHSIIYGHNMRNGGMFHDLVSYTEESYFTDHPYILIASPSGETKRLKIIAAYVASGNEALRQTQFADADEFHSFVQTALDRCPYSLDLAVEDVGHLYTFATCSYQFDGARTLVHAVEVDKDGTIIKNDSQA
ncbi:MAG: class B sortase [Actinobacteria bacterium]|nr:class B sortase [Actinomycetota bacterium]